MYLDKIIDNELFIRLMINDDTFYTYVLKIPTISET